MSTTTTNLGLIKPDSADLVDISQINSNMDKIDSTLGTTPSQIGTLSSLTTTDKTSCVAAINSLQTLYSKTGGYLSTWNKDRIIVEGVTYSNTVSQTFSASGYTYVSVSFSQHYSKTDYMGVASTYSSPVFIPKAVLVKSGTDATKLLWVATVDVQTTSTRDSDGNGGTVTATVNGWVVNTTSSAVSNPTIVLQGFFCNSLKSIADEYGWTPT